MRLRNVVTGLRGGRRGGGPDRRHREAHGCPAAAEDYGEQLLQSEVRARLAKMDRKSRGEAIHAAIVNGDELLCSAVLSAPAMLSGLSPEEHEMRRHAWRTRRHTGEFERAGRLGAAMADVDRGAGALIAFVDGLTNADLIARAERTEREAREAVEAAAGADA
jgi:hypothetical protein